MQPVDLEERGRLVEESDVPSVVGSSPSQVSGWPASSVGTEMSVMVESAVESVADDMVVTLVDDGVERHSSCYHERTSSGAMRRALDRRERKRRASGSG